MVEGCHDCIDLCECPAGTVGTVSCIQRANVSAVTVRRLAELGIRRGVELTAAHRTPGGGRVIAIGDVRLALDRATLRSLHLTTTAEAQRTPTAASA